MVLIVRIFLVLTFVGSMGLAAIGGKSIWGLWVIRRALKDWEEDIEENKWGVGQVLALFAWAPWLIDLAYSGAGSVRSYLRSDRAESGSQVAEDAVLEYVV